MKTVGAFEAKTHLSALLDDVAKGERITITKHGCPAAMLVPVHTSAALSGDELAARFAAFRRRQSPVSRRERKTWVDEGRK
jgi:prevent-host-death family protein